jgi:hypothetical protein
MPGMDRTGPLGMGPGSGRGLGRCGRGFGRGIGRGFSRLETLPEERLPETTKSELEERIARLEAELSQLKAQQGS